MENASLNPRLDGEALRRARRAYEVGRLRAAFRSTPVVLALATVSLISTHRPALSLTVGAAVLVLTVGFAHRGGIYGRAVMPGLLTGGVPMMLPILLRSDAHCCVGGGCWSVCMAACIGGGLIAGAALGLASASEKDRWTFLGASAFLSGLVGVLGCGVIGTAGIAGMVMAVMVSSLPVAAIAKARWPA